MKVKDLISRKNLLFLVPVKPLRYAMFIRYTSSNDPDFLIPCVIGDKYNLEEGYKIELIPSFGYDSKFERKSFYQTDFETMVANGTIRVFEEIK